MRDTIREAAGTVHRTGPGRIQVRIIDAGQGSSGTYPPEVLERAATERAFARGTQMHLDHSTPTDMQERPEGSLRNLVGVLTEDARYEDGALVAEARIGSQWRDFVDDFHEFIGVSISAAAEVNENAGDRVIERIVPDPFNRADFVTVPGRGGRVTAVLEAAQKITNPDAPQGPDKEEATMAETNITEALNRAAEAEANNTNLAAENERLKARIKELEATIEKLKDEKAAEAAQSRKDAATGVLTEHFGEQAPAFLVRATEHAATDENFDLDAFTADVKAAREALTDTAAPTVAHTTETAGRTYTTREVAESF